MAGSPYHASLDTPLLRFGRDKWRIRDAAEGTAIWGAPGSGKSSGSAKALAKSFLAAGMGGVVLCAKPDEADTWRAYAVQTGRSEDVITLDASGAHRFNFLDYAAATYAGPGFEHNLVALMAQMIEASRIGDDSGDGGENKFFRDGALKWTANAFPLLRLAHGTIRLRDLNAFIGSAPISPEQTKKPHIDQWVSSSFCGKTILLAGERAKLLQGDAKHHANRILADHGNFFMEEVARLDNRPRSSIEATLTNMIFPFISGKLTELFCTTTTITPDAARDGKIILLDIPALTYGHAGIVGQTLFKYLFGQSVQRVASDEKTRPVFLFADEAQFFMNSADAELLSTARSSKACIVYVTQDMPTYFARLGFQNKSLAESIISKFGTRIFHANTSRETNQLASELIGKTEKFHAGASQSDSYNSGGGDSRHDRGGSYQGQDSRNRAHTKSASGYSEWEIVPEYFAKELRTGGPANRLKVDGIVIRNGRNWKKTGKHWVKAEFDQKC